VGEPLRETLGRDEVAALLAGVGFALRSDDSTVAWAARYWPWQRGVRPIERLAVAERIA
jgi:hypothetical protein